MRHERPLLYTLLTLLLLLITLPYFYAYHLTPPNHTYTGLLWLPDDQNVHLTWAKQASEGYFLFPNLYSSDTLHTPPSFSNLVLWTIGTTARFTGLPLILTYHLYRLLFTALAVLTFHKLTTLLTTDARIRLTATFLVCFSAGFGYLILPFQDPATSNLMDLPRSRLFVPEAYTFTSALIYPLNIASLYLLSATYYYLLKSHQTQKLRHAIYAGLAALILGNSHTYDSLPLLATLTLYFFILIFGVGRSMFDVRRSPSPPSPGTPGEGRGEGSAPRPSDLHKDLASARDAGVSPARSSSFLHHPSFFTLLVLLLASLPVLIQALLFFLNPEFRYSKTHYPVTPPPFLALVVSFGPLIPLAANYAPHTRKHPPSLLLTLWATTTLLLMYANDLLSPLTALGLPLHFNFGRKLIEGLQLPLSFLAASALFHLLDRLNPQSPNPPPFRNPQSAIRNRAILIAVLLSSSLSLPLILTQILHHRTDPTWPTPRTPLDLPTNYAAALHYLDHLPPDQKKTAVVLAMPPLSNHLPPRTGLHTYVGHWAESIRFVPKFWTAHKFFSGEMSRADTTEFLIKNPLTHLFEHPPTDPSPTTRPSTRLSLPSPLFHSGPAAIYPLPKIHPTTAPTPTTSDTRR